MYHVHFGICLYRVISNLCWKCTGNYETDIFFLYLPIKHSEWNSHNHQIMFIFFKVCIFERKQNISNIPFCLNKKQFVWCKMCEAKCHAAFLEHLSVHNPNTFLRTCYRYLIHNQFAQDSSAKSCQNSRDF